MRSNVKRAFTPLRLALLGAALLVVAIVLLFRSSDDYLRVPDEAHSLAGLVRVPGARAAPGRVGAIYYVDVLERPATLLERLIPSLRPTGADLVPRRDLAPSGINERERLAIDAREMKLSQQIATGVALRELGYSVRLAATGVRVAALVAGTKAVGKLEPSDVITAVDGKRVRVLLELRREIAKHRVGQTVLVKVRRGDGVRRVRIRLSADPAQHGRPIMGILTEQAYEIHVPFQVNFDLRNVGGPSAGLAFALQILEERGRDVDHGYKVAATGEILPDGSIGEIGGVKQKVAGVREAHADVFLVPAGPNASEAKRYADGLRVIPVRTFKGALRSLATLPPKS
jgi:PDZ domain-containing protein